MELAEPGPEWLVEAARAHGVRDRRLLAAIQSVPRAWFVPSELEGEAYLDKPLAIPHHQVTTQPSLVAQMVEALGLVGSDKVLEVGTGYGWQSALLGMLAGRVLSVERWPELARTARENLRQAGVTSVRVVVGDGSAGLPDEAPFDAVILAAAFPEVPSALADQLATGGRLVQPIGPGGHDDVTLFERRGDELVKVRSIVPAHFVRLYGRHGYPGAND